MKIKELDGFPKKRDLSKIDALDKVEKPYGWGSFLGQNKMIDTIGNLEIELDVERVWEHIKYGMSAHPHREWFMEINTPKDKMAIHREENLTHLKLIAQAIAKECPIKVKED